MAESAEGPSAVRIQCNGPSFYSGLVMLRKAKCGMPFEGQGRRHVRYVSGPCPQGAGLDRCARAIGGRGMWTVMTMIP